MLHAWYGSRALPAILLALAVMPDTSAARTISFEQRVRAQEAIARVAYSHLTGATRPSRTSRTRRSTR